MKKYFEIIQHYKWYIVFLVPLFIVLFSYKLLYITFDGSYRVWYDKDSQLLKDYDTFRETFSNDDAVIIVFKDEQGIFNPKAIQSIARITEAFLQKGYIDRVDSLTNFQYIHTNPTDVDEVVVEDFIKKPYTQDYLDKRKPIAFTQDMLVDKFISKDAKTTLIFARLTPEANEMGNQFKTIVKDTNAIVDAEHSKTGYKYYVSGGPAANEIFVSIATQDIVFFVPIVSMIALMLLFLLFRTTWGAFIPLLVVGLSILLVMSLKVAFGYSLNNFTANIPAFIMAIGIADALHIFSIWHLKRREGLNNVDAVRYSLEKNFKPIFYTTISTMVGFLSLTISNITPINTLGISVSLGALIAFLMSIVWMPAVLLTIKKEFYTGGMVTTGNIMQGYGTFIVSHYKKIIATFILMMGFIAIGLANLRVDSNLIRFLDKEVEFRKSSEFIMQNLTGVMNYAIIIDSKKQGGIKEPAFLQTVDAFGNDFLRAFPKEVRGTQSMIDALKEYNLMFNQSKTIPQSRELVAQYLLLYSMGLPPEKSMRDSIDFNEQKFRLTALTNIVHTSKDLEMMDFIDKWWQNKPYTIVVTGQTSMFAKMNREITNTLFYSLALTLLVVSMMMYIIFRNIRLLWIMILPNILPVFFVLGVMGYLGIAIDLGIAICGAIIIGIAVDDTIHYLHKYFDAKTNNIRVEDRLNEVLRYAGSAILFTTIVLSLAFGVLIISDFVPNQNFGIVTATALCFALIIDLLLLPALLVAFDKKEN